MTTPAPSTPPALDQVFVPGEDLVRRTLADETFIVPIRGELAQLQNVFVLEGVGGFIWEKLDGKCALREIRDAVIEAFDVSEDEATRDCLAFIEALQQAGLVEAKA